MGMKFPTGGLSGGALAQRGVPALSRISAAKRFLAARIAGQAQASVDRQCIPMRLAPKDKVVDIGVVDLLAAEQTLQRAQAVLSGDELQRSRRFRFPVDCRRFVMARANLRWILASYLQVAAQTLVFDYSEYGKPTHSRAAVGNAT